MNDRPIWISVDAMREAMRGCGDFRSIAIAMTLLSIYAPEGAGAFSSDPESIAALVSTPREVITAAEIDSMRGDLLRFFVVLDDGRWAPNHEIFVANDPNGEVAN